MLRYFYFDDPVSSYFLYFQAGHLHPLINMKLLTSALLLLCLHFAQAQVTFEKWLGGSNSDEAKGVVQLPDSGFAILGRSWSYSNGGSDILLVRTDKYGDTLWTKHYGGTSNEFTNGAIKITPEGGFVIAGNTYSFGTGTPAGFNWYLIKTDFEGNVLWTKTWGSIGNDELKHVLVTSDGNYLLTGAWLVSGFTTGIVLKIDADGNTLWSDDLPSSGTSHFMYACENAQHEYVVAGYTLSGTYNALTRKYDEAGNMLISKMYEAPTAEAAITIEPVPAGGYICSATWGQSFSFDPWILRLDENLDTIFTRIMDFNYSIAGNSAKEYSIYPCEGGFFICGSDSNRMMLRKTDAELNTIWEEVYGGAMGESGYEGIPTNDGGFIAVGLTFSYGAGMADAYFVKTDAYGMLQIPVGISIAGNNMMAIYPNPTSGIFVIKRNVSAENTKAKVCNSSGRTVMQIAINSAATMVDLSGQPPGVYFLLIDKLGKPLPFTLGKN